MLDLVLERDIREICLEAIRILDDKDSIQTDDIIGYFHEILTILEEEGDDLK